MDERPPSGAGVRPASDSDLDCRAARRMVADRAFAKSTQDDYSYVNKALHTQFLIESVVCLLAFAYAINGVGAMLG